MHTDDSVQVQFSSRGSNDPPIFSAEGAMKNIAFGSFAGMVSEIIGYPFDLAKVRLQAQLLTSTSSAQLRFNGPMDCLKHTWKEEGIRGLYRGLSVPMVGSMAETAVLFFAYSSFQNIIRAYSGAPREYNSNGRLPPLSIPQLATAAAGAGFVTSFFLTPIELVKCKMQVQMMNMPSPPAHTYHRPASAIIPSARSLPPHAHHTSRLKTLNFISNAHHTLLEHAHASARRPPGAFSIIRSTIQTYGMRGLWLGHTGTLLRETGGTAAWFVIKEMVTMSLRDRRTPAESYTLSPSADENMDPLPWESALSGAIAGGLCVLMFYPADTVKSAMQTVDELRPPRAGASAVAKSGHTFMGTLARMYGTHGIRGLYSGCGMTVARAVPSSGIVFLVYDGLASWLE